jgi:hypothetical protein
MTRLMYDSTRPEQIPHDADMVLHPVNGEFAWTPNPGRWKSHQVVGYDALGQSDAWLHASMIDWETGMVQDPGKLLLFVRKRNEYRPDTATVYCDRSNVRRVTAILRGEPWHLGLADPTSKQHVGEPDSISGPFDNLVFTQYRWPPKGATEDFYDVSLVSDDRWHAGT